MGGSNWICVCDCGTEVIAVGSNLRRGSTKSCGCLAQEWSTHMGGNPEFIAKRAKSITRHGHKRKNAATVEYKTWLGMKRRCYDEKYKDYPNWGGRGIKVCDRWNDSFEAFLEDMGPRPSANHSIDRMQVNGNYEPGNCRWATLQEQGAEHRRNLTPVEIDGKCYPSLKAACAAYDVTYTAVFDRIKRGYDIEVALKTPIRKLPNTRTHESYLRKDSR
jgi:hypothetical protein